MTRFPVQSVGIGSAAVEVFPLTDVTGGKVTPLPSPMWACFEKNLCPCVLDIEPGPALQNRMCGVRTVG